MTCHDDDDDDDIDHNITFPCDITEATPSRLKLNGAVKVKTQSH